jgi:hypothetical protein
VGALMVANCPASVGGKAGWALAELVISKIKQIVLYKLRNLNFM